MNQIMNNVYSKFQKTINSEKIYILFELTLVLLFFHDNVFPSELTLVSLLLVIIFGLFIILKNKKMYYNPFLVSYFVFIIIVATMTLIFGKGEGDTIRRLGLIIAQFVAAIAIFNYLMNTKDIKKFMKIFAIVGFVSLIIIFILLGNRAFTTRLGHNGASRTVSYFINNTPIYKSSNGTANFCAIATLFLLYFSNNTNNKKQKIMYYLISAFLIFGLLLCGSRKGFFVLFVFIIYSFIQLKVSKKTKAIIFSLGIIIVIILIFNVPFLYNAIGSRVESTFLSLVGISNDLDQNSLIARNNLKDSAIEWIGKQPIFGYGFNVFENHIGNGAENNVLQIMLDFGLIGLVAYYSFIVPFINTIKKGNKKNKLYTLVLVLIICILLQDIGTVSYSWLSITMWYSVYWAVFYIEQKNKKWLEIKNRNIVKGEKNDEE